MQPVQSLIRTDKGISFQPNEIIRKLFYDRFSDNDFNWMALTYSPEDLEQLIQLLGVSFHDFSKSKFISDRTYARACQNGIAK